jgi:dynein assembly factor 5
MLDRLIREFQGTCSDAAIQVNPYIQLIPRVVMGCADPCVLLSVIVPALHARLATPVIVETSEEIRLLLLVRTTELVGMCEDKSSPYIQELSEIVQRTLHDPFPDVKKVGSGVNTNLLGNL